MAYSRGALAESQQVSPWATAPQNSNGSRHFDNYKTMGSGGSVPVSNRQSIGDAETPCEQVEIQGELQTPEGPVDSQGPSPYATLRRDDWWQQRPSAPSLPGVSIRGSYSGPIEGEANLHQETLLAYASQMTGWQSGVASNPGSTRSEVTELSRTVSCLATANQQLAAAHGAALAHLEALYRDLRSVRLSKDCEKELEKNGNREEDDEEKRRTSFYVARLESLLTARNHTEENSNGDDKDSLKNAMARIEELEDTLRNERLRNQVDKHEPCNVTEVLNSEKEVQCDQVDEDDQAKLREEIELQKQRIARLEERCEASAREREKVESELIVSRGEVDRLSSELEMSNGQRTSLEQDLQKSIMDRDHVRISEGQKSAKLRAQLAEEVADKKKQIKALEDAVEEIQRLKLTVKSDKRESNSVDDDEEASKDSSTETTAVLETVYGSEEVACGRTTNMEEFKKELTLKREARQRALAAVSSEMDRLRKELGAEKEAHSETSRMLDLLKSGEPGETVKEPAECTVDEVVAKLKVDLHEEKEAHQETLRRITAQQIADTLKVSDEIKNFVRFETEKLEDLRYHLERDTDKNERQISEVKEAVGAARLVLAARETQVNKLKDQLAQILARLDGTNYSVIFDDARAEFDHQLENLRNLKTLYKVRLKVLIELKENASRELARTKEKLEISEKKLKTVEEDLEKSEEKVDVQDTEISNLESQLGLTKADCRDLENQMSVINSLFTQMLLSASSADMDLDRLTRLLQENHDLISDMAREEGTEAAALPKLLLDLVEQVEGRSATKTRISNEDGTKNEEDIQEENIAHNLPKVWNVLLELLSCHAVDVPSPPASALSCPDSCYKSVDTPTGPQLVISVSKTYIRLKELILEKKHLEKEMTRMKQLNTHLESKLGEQEKRLSTVSSELSKTWNIVGRMQAQHQQLHTHEKILRYELQQKRKMLQELKQELEYCREKWESARQKNTNTELEWKSLRREFAARKALAVRDSLNNSGESGFSDERGDESDEEDEGRAERIRISPRRRTRKESPRVPTPDTESEQPTDTEMSESKTCSSETLEQRTPTPETETEVDAEMIEADPIPSEARPPTPEPDCTPEVEILDPLDRALTNVIQSLIKIDTVSNTSSASTSRESLPMPSTSSADSSSTDRRANSSCRTQTREWSPHSEPWSSSKTDKNLPSLSYQKKSRISERALESADPKTDLEEHKDAEEPSTICDQVEKLEESNSTDLEANPVPEVSLFSIGPHPTSESPPPVKTVQFREPLILGPSVQSRTEDEPSKSSSSTESKTEEAAVSESQEVENSADQISENSLQPKIEESRITPEVPEATASSSAVVPAPEPSSSSVPKASRTPEEVLAARAARLKRLEEQADWLMKKMNATSQRGTALSTRLEELHEVYGEPPAPPPLPDVLPSLRLETNCNQEEEEVERPTPEAVSSAPQDDASETKTDANESPPDNAP